MHVSFDPDLIVCRRCNQHVVWSDYNTSCINCKSSNWSYELSELLLAQKAKKLPFEPFNLIVCKVCKTTNRNPSGLSCVHCNESKWGYNDFELRYHLFAKQSAVSSSGGVTEQDIPKHGFADSLPVSQELAGKPFNANGNNQKQQEIPSEYKSKENYISTEHEPKSVGRHPISKPSLKFVSVTVLGGILIGLAINFFLSFLSYHQYKDAILNSRAFLTTFINDPVLNQRFFQADNELHPSGTSDFNWRLLVNMGVLDWRSSKEDVSPRLDAALDKLKNKVPRLQEKTSLDVLCIVLEGLGREQNSVYQGNTFTLRKNLLATCFAAGPGAYNALKHFNNTAVSGSQNTNTLKFLLPINFWEEKLQLQKILSELIADTHADSEFRDLLQKEKENNGSSLELKDEYAQINDFLMRFAIGIHDDPTVKSAKNGFLIMVGIEQYYMYLIFGIGLLILIRNRQNRISEGNRKFSVVMYRWIYIALPSLGFIGTKRGLSKALSGADSIVRANTEVNQSLAISEVSDTMGIAFTSTLVGLVLLMILMLGELIKRYKYINWDE